MTAESRTVWPADHQGRVGDKLICEVHRETSREEADIFPRLARYADESTLIELGAQIQAFKDTRH